MRKEIVTVNGYASLFVYKPRKKECGPGRPPKIGKSVHRNLVYRWLIKGFDGNGMPITKIEIAGHIFVEFSHNMTKPPKKNK